MNFRQLVGQYALGNLATEQLRNVAYKALEEGFESPSLIILAGIEKGENSFVVEGYFKAALAELNIGVPDKRAAALEYAIMIAQDVIDGKKDVFEGVGEIISEVIQTQDFELDTTKYLYDGIFFENVYGLYYNCDDLETILIQISGDKSKEELIGEIRKELLDELMIWKEKVESKILNQ